MIIREVINKQQDAEQLRGIDPGGGGLRGIDPGARRRATAQNWVARDRPRGRGCGLPPQNWVARDRPRPRGPVRGIDPDDGVLRIATFDFRA